MDDFVDHADGVVTSSRDKAVAALTEALPLITATTSNHFIYGGADLEALQQRVQAAISALGDFAASCHIARVFGDAVRTSLPDALEQDQQDFAQRL